MKDFKDFWPWWRRIGLLANRQKRRAFRLFKSFPALAYDTVVDLGAYKGEFTDAAIAVLNPRRLILVEADPVSVRKLEEKYKCNERCSVHSNAITNRGGPVKLRINSHRDSSSILPINKISERIFGKRMEEIKEIEVNGVTLDDLFLQNQLTRVDLLKADIQGAEHLMIEGGKEALQRTNSLYIEVCFEEFYQGSFKFHELDNLLCEIGFKLRSFHECRLGSDHCLAYANALYLKQNKIS